MDQGNLHALIEAPGVSAPRARALLVSGGGDGDDVMSVLVDLGWETHRAVDADAAIAALGNTAVDVLVLTGTPDVGGHAPTKTLLALARKRHLTTVIIGDDVRLPTEGGPLFLTRIPSRTSALELRGRLAMVQQYHHMLHSVERELDKMQQFSDRLGDHFREVDEGMKLAGRLQRDFLPNLSEPFGGVRFASIFRPVTWVSGDMFDVFRIDDNHTGVYLGDAVGHGMSASLLTMFIKRAIVSTRITTAGREVVPPSEVLAGLNDALAEQELPNCQFVTACYGVIDHRARTFTFARGGHPYPIRMSKNGDLEELRAVGGLLGLFAGAEFPSTIIPLDRGDKVVLYTDGIEHVAPRIVPAAPDVPDAIHTLLGTLAGGDLLEGISRLEALLDTGVDESLPQDDLTIVAFELPV